MRVVFFSDTHLGLDMPARRSFVPHVPSLRSVRAVSIDRRRRGEDFFANVDRVLDYAEAERVDLVLHGGDLFFRSRVPPFIVDRVYARLVQFVESTGIPLGVIAGNHERSALPTSLFLRHPLLHVFHAASAHAFDVGGARVVVAGVPFVGDGARFVTHARTAIDSVRGGADATLLMAHEAFEGAVCGAGDGGGTFTFPRDRGDVVSLDAVPDRFDVVLSGHIHRRQVLWRARADGSRVPIVYAGSVERTSFAERGETKSFVVVDLTTRRLRFVPLPARPMHVVEAGAVDGVDAIVERVCGGAADAVVRVTCDVALAMRLRRVRWPASMSVELRVRAT